MELKRYKLGEICPEFHAGNGIQSSQIKGSGLYPVFGGNGLRGYTDTFNQDGQYLIIGRQGAYCGNVRYNVGKAFLTEHAIVGQTSAEHNAIYLACKLSLMNLAQFQGQSAQPGLSVKNLSEIEILMPPKKIQDNIARVILNIDHKIALNRAINQNLEAMAKQLYDYWFVQFDFPDEEGKPYKSSGGAMVWNEKLHREIPCNWDVVSLSEYLNVYSDKVSAINLDVNSKYAPIEVLPRRKMSFNECAPIENAVSGLCRFGKKHILLSNRRVYFHKVCIAAFDGVTRDTVIILSPVNKALLGYAYQIINDDVFIEYATRHSYGSEQPVLSWESAKMFKTLKPSNQLDVIYSNRICSIIDSVIRNELEIAELTKQRDELLPLLMNGQVSVNSDLLHLFIYYKEIYKIRKQ